MERFDLSGYRTEVWYKLTGFGTVRYYLTEQRAQEELKSHDQMHHRGFWVEPVLVVTKDGKTGFVFDPSEEVTFTV